MTKRIATALAAVSLLAAFSPGIPPAAAAPSEGFVTRQGKDLRLDGRQFRFAGSNNYYLMYKSPRMVDDVFADARDAGFTVLRTWGFLDIGNQDGSNSVRGKQEGIYFQYWDGDSPAYNDGPDGLRKLDYVLASARAHGIRLIIPLTNNWNDFGGMDQYVRWAGGAFHDDFYTNPVIRGWYQDWISHVLNRVNPLTGLAYKDDPTVMAWELGNEPRCLSAGAYPRSPNCTTATLTAWADQLSRHIKSVDPNHLVGVGDEGFFCDDPAHEDWTRSCGEGVDTLAFTRLPAIDLMSFHIYPAAWGKDLPWTFDWVRRHVREANRIGKPVLWGEFGWLEKATRNTVYKTWTDIFDQEGGDGWLYWILSGIQDDGTLYPDFDGFTVYCPSPVCRTLTNAGEELTGPQRSRPPVADHDAAVVEFNQPARLSPTGNDVAYRTYLQPATIDLDPSVSGQQRGVTVPGGAFALAADGTVTFTPADAFVGRATAHYTVRDAAGRTSNVADLTVTVKPDPTAAIPVATFEAGTEGWGPGNWMPDAGAVDRTADFHPEGAFGLNLAVTAGHWFGRVFAEPLNLSGKSTVAFELRTGSNGSSVALALQMGNDFTWCQSSFPFIGPDTTTTIRVDLLTDFSCGIEGLSDVRALWLFFAPGSYDIDNVRAL
ncbi:MAG TPA: cellulase family glycosylhydrolase [Actinophytocola sp.]|uniref:cellulase family glycosylhydrolase n=1 Tax=Actinophytocola sp. TaxID=1872138 RepID=UPI002DB6D4D6|nr:cellulase family glycosylhydrolase [Actinophytocola sp.]HEU5469096.1 cellulase family glycosylhydrolase [Actinophytocola sp.]